MTALIKKELKMFLLYTLPVLPPVTAYWLAGRDGLSPLLVLAQGALAYLLMVIPVMVNEQYEEKHNGYKIQRILPVTWREIVGAKFLALVIAMVVLAGFNHVLFGFFTAAPDHLALSRAFVHIMAMGGLLSGAVLYTGSLALGYTLFMKVMVFVMVAVGLIPPIVKFYAKPDMNNVLPRLGDWILQMTTGTKLLILGAVLVTSLVLMSVALAFEHKET